MFCQRERKNFLELDVSFYQLNADHMNLERINAKL